MVRKRRDEGVKIIFNAPHGDSHSVFDHGNQYHAEGYGRSQVSQQNHGSSAVAKLAAMTAILILTAALLNLFTAVKPYTWAYDQLTRSSKDLEGTTPSGTTPSTASVTPQHGSTAFTTTSDEAEATIRRYLTLARAGNVRAMWQLTSPSSQAQSKKAYDDWWGHTVADLQGPYFEDNALDPVEESDGGLWVQFAVRFKETGRTGWVDHFDIFWYKVVTLNGRHLIDAGSGKEQCSLDIAKLATCERHRPLR